MGFAILIKNVKYIRMLVPVATKVFICHVVRYLLLVNLLRVCKRGNIRQ